MNDEDGKFIASQLLAITKDRKLACFLMYHLFHRYEKKRLKIVLLVSIMRSQQILVYLFKLKMSMRLRTLFTENGMMMESGYLRLMSYVYKINCG